MPNLPLLLLLQPRYPCTSLFFSILSTILPSFFPSWTKKKKNSCRACVGRGKGKETGHTRGRPWTHPAGCVRSHLSRRPKSSFVAPKQETALLRRSSEQVDEFHDKRNIC